MWISCAHIAHSLWINGHKYVDIQQFDVDMLCTCL